MTPISCDVSEHEAVQKVFAEITAATQGKIHVLVNSAGVNIQERHSNVRLLFMAGWRSCEIASVRLKRPGFKSRSCQMMLFSSIPSDNLGDNSLHP
jgi:NAD(P)-dependent dehydrogenase (short-subunit alcohol dehydrogenase family)